MRHLQTLVLVGLGVLGLIAGLGLVVPEARVVHARVVYRRPAETIWATLVELERWPEWNSAVSSVERRARRDGNDVWRLTGAHGVMDLEIVQVDELVELRAHGVADEIDGVWTYRLERVRAGTLLTVTEEARVSSPLTRGLTLFDAADGAALQFLQDIGDWHELEVRPRSIDDP